MKRAILLFCSICLALSIAGCSGEQAAPGPEQTQQPPETTEQDEAADLDRITREAFLEQFTAGDAFHLTLQTETSLSELTETGPEDRRLAADYDVAQDDEAAVCTLRLCYDTETELVCYIDLTGERIGPAMKQLLAVLSPASSGSLYEKLDSTGREATSASAGKVSYTCMDAEGTGRVTLSAVFEQDTEAEKE